MLSELPQMQADLRSKAACQHNVLTDATCVQVAAPGSVKVEAFMDIERYSHVMHISSTVTGRLRSSHCAWDALRAALPVGTVSGAPKVLSRCLPLEDLCVLLLPA